MKHSNADALITSVLEQLAEEELNSMPPSGSPDAEYLRTLPGIRSHIFSAHKPKGYPQRRMIVLALVTILLLTGVCTAAPQLYAKLDLTHRSVGAESRREVYEAVGTVDFTLDENGLLQVYQYRLEGAYFTIDDTIGIGKQDTRKVATWTGKIKYLKYEISRYDATTDTLSVSEYYLPVAFSQSVALHTDDIILHELTIRGGAQGQAYDVNANLQPVQCAIGSSDWQVKYPRPGAVYEETLDNESYAFARHTDSIASNVSTAGTFTYSIPGDSTQTLYTTSECILNLIR